MGILLAAHLGLVLGLFVTMPYGKFVHGLYRFAALVRNAVEKRREIEFRLLSAHFPIYTPHQRVT